MKREVFAGPRSRASLELDEKLEGEVEISQDEEKQVESDRQAPRRLEPGAKPVKQLL